MGVTDIGYIERSPTVPRGKENVHALRDGDRLGDSLRALAQVGDRQDTILH